MTLRRAANSFLFALFLSVLLSALAMVWGLAAEALALYAEHAWTIFWVHMIAQTWIWAWRCIRWQLLLPHHVPLGKLATVDAATYMLAKILPAHLGELAAPVMLAQRTDNTFGDGLSVATLTRALDLSTIALILVVLLAYGIDIAEAALPAVVFVMAVVLGALGGLWAVARFGRRVASWVRTTSLPDFIAQALTELVDALHALADRPGRAVPASVATLMMWGGDVVSLGLPAYLIAPDQATVWSGFACIAGAIVGILVAPTPGGAGSVHAGGMAGLMATGIDLEAARATMVLSHAFCVLYVVVVGLAAAARLGTTPDQITEETLASTTQT